MKKFLTFKYALILIIVIALVGVFVYWGRDESLPYDFMTVSERDVSQEVSVVGRVEAAEEVGLSFNLSGRIVNIPFSVGDTVSQGQVLMSLDYKDAQNSIKNAEINLENSKVALEKVIRQETGDIVAKQSAESQLAVLFEKAFNTLSVVYANVPSKISNLEDVFEAQALGLDEKEGSVDYYNGVVNIYYPLHFYPREYESDYNSVKATVNSSFDSYKTISKFSSPEVIAEFLDEAYNAVKISADFIREARDTTLLYQQVLKEKNLTPTKISVSDTNSHLSQLSDLASELEGYSLSLFSIRQDINDKQETVVNTDLDLKTQQLLVEQRQNELESAYNHLSDHHLKAPFDGVVTEVVGKVGEFISSNQKAIFLISSGLFDLEANVPEADISKVKVGQEAEVVFDAFGQDHVFEARVSKIDPAGVLIDGVATYKVTFILEEGGDIVRPGMTADIDILGETVSEVLAVPARAIIRRDGKQFVQILDTEDKLREVEIVSGLRGSDGFVEVVQGLQKGDRVVTAVR